MWETGESAKDILKAPRWPSSFPLGPQHLARLDESADTKFYAQPRFVHHIDEHAIATLQKYYRGVLPRGGAVLDLMSSWTSHLAPDAGQDKADGWFKRVSAVGMVDAELQRNPALHDYHVADLNASPTLAMYESESFDAVFCSVSVDYLSNPLPVFAEIRRVLKPDGIAVFTWSNRMFPTKATRAWREASEPARLWICGSFFHFTPKGAGGGSGFSPPVGLDLSPHGGRSDPVYVVSARKLADDEGATRDEL